MSRPLMTTVRIDRFGGPDVLASLQAGQTVPWSR